MPVITLPDGTKKVFDQPTSAAEVAMSIGAGLAKAAIAAKVDGIQRDIYLPIAQDAKLEILTLKAEEGLEIMRHTLTAQVLARALKELFSDVKLAIGPTVDNGFYYDISTPQKISVDDLPKIEKRMAEIIAEGSSITREMLAKADAIRLFKDRGEPFKVDIIENAKDDDTTEAGKISIYWQGEDKRFVDLCRGPHLESLAKMPPAFKLTKVSGAYWRGDVNNEQLQRIYGVAFADKKQLDAYLHMLEEAEKRDHRKIGRELKLFHIQEEAVGQIFWHPKGWSIYQALQRYIAGKLETGGYVEVKTPILVGRKLWEDSGHWEKFRENMFTSENDKDTVLAIKPMNCPCHVQIFKQEPVSYKQLPIRMAEFGTCHRNEPSGGLHGLMRVRGFTQDDAHIFCTESQIEEEVIKFCDLLKEVYKELGFEKVKVKFSDRPEVRAGTDETWDKAEKALTDAVKATNLEYSLNPGEGAFYGPKLEFVLTDAIGRDWQCGTLQVDFVLPERLDANYIGSDDKKHRPVMLHRAILGSFERFIGILIEQYAGKFPLWLAPEQVVICTITEAQNEYAEEILRKLQALGIRARADLRNEKISYKIREHMNDKIPVVFAVGAKEVEKQAVSVRRLDGTDRLVEDSVDVAIESLLYEINLKKDIPYTKLKVK